MTREELQEKSIDELISLMPKDYMIGPTVFDQPEKKYLCCHYQESIIDYLDEDYSDITAETCPDGPYLKFYGSSIKETLINCILTQGGDL